MHTKFHTCKLVMAVVLLAALNPFPGQSQTSSVAVTSLPANNYLIGTTNLNPDDLVFYRYSDGVDQTAMNANANSQASVMRQFKAGSAKVTAYIAPKNGPVGLATNDVNNSSCGSCSAPQIGLVTGEYVRIRNTSWNAYVDPAAPASMADNKTTPTFNTPTIPWFILPVTFKAPGPNSYVEIDIPTGMTVKGAIVKDIWKELFLSQSLFTITDPDVASFSNNSLSKVRINLTSSYNREFNVYFIIGSSTIVGQQSTFSAQLYNSNGVPLGGSSVLGITTTEHPHDPNFLTGFQTELCKYRSSNPQVGYRVDFQNLGAGLAETVQVQVSLNQNVLNGTSLSEANIHSSYPLTSFSTTSNTFTFTFQGINLSGLDQSPQPALDATKGWVEFSVDPRPCLNTNSAYFLADAIVTFTGNNGNYTENTPTNTLRQYLGDCIPDPLCSSDNRDLTEQPDVPQCYPTPFQNELDVILPACNSDRKVEITMISMSGEKCIRQEVSVGANDAMNHILNTSALPSGLYVVRIHPNMGADSMFKVIKQ